LLADGDATPDQLRAGLARAAGFAETTAAGLDHQALSLTGIMMARDYQDQSGQVIQMVIETIGRTEAQLWRRLNDSAPEHLAEVTAANAAQLQGPKVPSKALKQDDVDDLLDSLGF
jgi:chemotaxis protein CheZ